VEEAHMRKIFDASAEAFRDHWGYVEPTETDYLRWLEDPNRDPSIWKVAWAGDEVVGMVGNFIDKDSNETFNRKRGYTEDISVRRQWRRQGVARALLTRSIQMFIDMGMVETYLGVDTENPNGALQLYTSVGYQQERVGITYRKELQS
jgi:mycothiol synthase